MEEEISYAGQLNNVPKPKRPGVRCTTSALLCTSCTRGVQENGTICLFVLQTAEILGLIIFRNTFPMRGCDDGAAKPVFIILRKIHYRVLYINYIENTVFLWLKAAATINLVTDMMWRLFEGGVYSRAAFIL